ncbi:Selenocysteine-specific elongation factor [Gossypium arboreum]|uniref:Selenocysteine-specific elongation factor n=1 Tax=Gossypium arboreum TaxID=29729 RepID=A0A0B0P604_GOSAR|nr:Selenocysteine-specific elongation factor [Gossypium arboreum]
MKNSYCFSNHYRMSQTSTSTLILTHPCGRGIYLTLDLGLGCFSFNAQARYFNPKPRMKQSSNPEQYE